MKHAVWIVRLGWGLIALAALFLSGVTDFVPVDLVPRLLALWNGTRWDEQAYVQVVAQAGASPSIGWGLLAIGAAAVALGSSMRTRSKQ